ALSGAAFTYAALFALGKMLLGFSPSAWVPLAIGALVAGILMIGCLRDRPPRLDNTGKSDPPPA
ncbi:MAG: hypothetical protein JSV16_13040, partial [Candidatus Hydrogenedentota bacterium]